MNVMTAEQFIKECQQAKGLDETRQEMEEQVRNIIQEVRQEGDVAVRRFVQQYDRVELTDLRVTLEEIEEAKALVGESMVDTLKRAHQQIENFHAAQREETWWMDQIDGGRVGQQVTPLDSVGIYIPGGKAAYPSTVLMNAVPAKLAGVQRIVMTTPPQRDGKVNPYVLVAAAIAGIDTIYKVGGAQAVAALAYGTETIDKVVKIVGPGNTYVATAKKQVFGDVAIDMIAGPSEICIVADHTTNPAFAAADLLAQAEHDEMASVYCFTTSQRFSQQLQEEVTEQMKELSRHQVIEQSIRDNSRLVLVDSLESAYRLVNELAPEHLQLMMEKPLEALPFIRNAGAVFLGQYAPEALGDYYAGPNHTLPTSGTAKFSSPLGVYDFMKKTSLIHYTAENLAQVADDIVKIARVEGLTAHAASIQIRKESR